MRAETDFCVGEQIYSLDQVQTYNTNITCADLATHEHGTFPSTTRWKGSLRPLFLKMHGFPDGPDCTLSFQQCPHWLSRKRATVPAGKMVEGTARVTQV